MIDEIFEKLSKTESDINEHLPTLKAYTEECDSVVEAGVRWIVSTYAFLAGRPKEMISIDIQDPSTWKASMDPVLECAKEINCDYKFYKANILEVEIPETDLLFIDTWHSYGQLKSELALHSSKVKKYIILHDTETYKTKNENSYSDWGWKSDYGDKQGLQPAIDEFLKEHPEWLLYEHFKNNNGLTILKRWLKKY